jgi:hypothetical protein
MNFPSRSQPPAHLRVVAAVLVACASGFLSGCSGSLIADHLPAAAGGLPDEAPERSANAGAYPAVHNMPPSRTTTTLNNDQQKQLEDDLVAARNRYGGNPDAPVTTGTTAAASGTTANAKAGSARNP